MYINEVINEIRRLSPNEYKTEELYRWCDELSAKIRTEYAPLYARAYLSAQNGCFTLPPDAGEICSVIAGTREIKKQDLRTMGFVREYTDDGYVLVDVSKTPQTELCVVYKLLHTPIRYVDKTVDILNVSEARGRVTLTLSSPIDIFSGDIIDVYAGEQVSTLSIVETGFDGENKTVSFIGEEPFEGSVRIVRHITEQTPCPSPYDAMYIDFLGAKIAWYQRNFSVYNYLEGAYLEKLSDYQRYLRRNAKKEPHTKIINYL